MLNSRNTIAFCAHSYTQHFNILNWIEGRRKVVFNHFILQFWRPIKIMNWIFFIEKEILMHAQFLWFSRVDHSIRIFILKHIFILDPKMKSTNKFNKIIHNISKRLTIYKYIFVCVWKGFTQLLLIHKFVHNNETQIKC